mmetsp:Transcript_17607/g.57104  ORF Transcript_17607/g.57104 Transcript_17607/m.57104 type:complete len:81 (+) Transcript_17607:2993-3235(+)
MISDLNDILGNACGFDDDAYWMFVNKLLQLWNIRGKLEARVLALQDIIEQHESMISQELMIVRRETANSAVSKHESTTFK